MSKNIFTLIMSIFLCSAALLDSGCGNYGTATSLGQGGVTAHLTWNGRSSEVAKMVASAPANVATVRLAIISSSGATLAQKDFNASLGSGILSSVPVGSGYTFAAYGLDASSNIIYQGAVNNVVVQDGQNTDVGTVIMYSVVSPYRQLSGVIYDTTTGLPSAGASVTAYKIVDGVKVTSPALSETVISGFDGSYVLNIPASYTGSVIVEASLPVPTGKLVARLLKILFSAPDGIVRAVVSDTVIKQSTLPPIVLSLASEAVVVFIEQNIINVTSAPSGFQKTGFSSDNIAKSIGVIETLFGNGFMERSPAVNSSATDITTTKSQQDLFVSLKAVNAALVSQSATLADLVTKIISPTGLGSLGDEIKSAITAVVSDLFQSSALPPTYTPNNAINAAISNVQVSPAIVSVRNDTVPPTAPSNVSVSVINAKTVRLMWDASTDDVGIYGYEVCRTTTSGIYSVIDIVLASGTGPVSYIDPTVSAGSTYTYKVIALDTSRNYSESSNSTTVTLPNNPGTTDTIKPSRPDLILMWATDSQVTMRWNLSTKTYNDGTVVPASGYFVYRNDQLVAVVNDTTFRDTGVVASTSYLYNVVAFDNNANASAASVPITVTTASDIASVVPSAPSNLQYYSVSYNKVALVWNASLTPGVTYNVYRGATRLVSGITDTRFTDTAVTPNSAYTYSVSAASSTAVSTASTLAVLVPPDPISTQSAPTVPQNLIMKSVSSNSVSLIWTASTKSDGNGVVAGYDIYRGDNSGTGMVLIASVVTPGFVDTTTAPSTAYTYQVKSFSTTGSRSAASTSIVVATAAPIDITDSSPPSTPNGLTLSTATTGNYVAITWNASNDNVAVAGYRGYRNGVQIFDSIGNQFIDVTVSDSTTYTYTVKAYDAAGNTSQSSNALTVTTPAPIYRYNISGRVVSSMDGSGLTGVTITLSGSGTSSTTTDSNGNYYFANALNGSYSISGTYNNLLMTPSSRSITVNNAHVTGQDFTVSFGTVQVNLGDISVTNPSIAIKVTGSAIPTASNSFSNNTGKYTVYVFPGNKLIVSARVLDPSGISLFEGFALGVTVLGGTITNVYPAMTVPIVKNTDTPCLSCHESTRDLFGQNLIAAYKQSAHYFNTSWTDNTKYGSLLPGCAGCHGTQHNDVNPSVSGRCWECHGSSLPSDLRHPTTGVTTTNCTFCHDAHNTKINNLNSI